MSFLSFTRGETRALQTLAVLLAVGSAVHLAKRWHGPAVPGYRLVAVTEVEPPPPKPVAADKLSQGINPNTATQEDLELLPGIGPGLASRIVRHRESQGPYKSPSDLLSVPGIGPRVLTRITPYLSFP